MFDAVYVRDLADYIAELYIIEYFMSLEHESPVKVELIMTSLLSHPSNITKHMALYLRHLIQGRLFHEIVTVQYM